MDLFVQNSPPMTDEDAEPESEPTFEQPEMVPQTVGSLLVSVSFWFVLLVAAGMYAAVALAPKLASWMNAHEQYADNAARLAALEEEADYLERLTAALKSDPAFAVRLVDAAQRQSARETGLVGFSGDSLPSEPPANSGVVQSAIQQPLAGLVFHLASHEPHRNWLLVGSCSLTLLAFSLLNEAGSGVVLSMLAMISSAVRLALGRYRTSSATAPDTDRDT